MLPVDGRLLENVKGEFLKLKKKEAADCQLWHNVARTEERKKQKNKEIACCQTWHNVGRSEEPKKQKNKEIADCLAYADSLRKKIHELNQPTFFPCIPTPTYWVYIDCEDGKPSYN
ncbi:hypothetical protein AVEN_97561-1 [Araneus ventricosus]|uniref:Uncharacterized protein n=1 Tax=Araneus ventricosus TaxID=182803 RepID=A0A4Y2F3S5_ARAVE|nr:hypothetical protein AVEN_97561-1 [Araneus ventricosus]